VPTATRDAVLDAVDDLCKIEVAERRRVAAARATSTARPSSRRRHLLVVVAGVLIRGASATPLAPGGGSSMPLPFSPGNSTAISVIAAIAGRAS
jgi:hypothetical protein